MGVFVPTRFSAGNVFKVFFCDVKAHAKKVAE
jgi:hypothetical protein